VFAMTVAPRVMEPVSAASCAPASPCRPRRHRKTAQARQCKACKANARGRFTAHSRARQVTHATAIPEVTQYVPRRSAQAVTP